MGQSKTIAVVLAGAVAKGAFEAGVIRALSYADADIVRIVASSSGALNGTMLAASVRTRELRAGAEQLVALWQDHAGWHDVFHTSFRDLLRGDGLSDQKRLLDIMREHVRPTQPAHPAEVNLRMIVAALHGYPGSIGARPATTFEYVCDFDSRAFGTRDGLERVFNAAVASAAFPLVFAPVDVPGVGPCVDGGAVNNTPMKWALDGAIGAAVDAIVVVATTVEERAQPPDDVHGTGLVGHVAEMLIEERLYRDLREAEQVNASIAAIDALVQRGEITDAQCRRVKDVLGWSNRRAVEIIPIRPVDELRGNAFAGFFDADLRREHLEIGYRRGLEVLHERGFGMRRSVRDDDLVGVAGDAIELPRAVEGDRAE